MPSFPLKISSSSRGLVDQNGIPFRINGDAGWNCAVSLNSTNANQYFTDRKSRGGNTVMLYMATSGNSPFNPPNLSPADLNGNLPFSKDLSGATFVYSDTQNADWSTYVDAYFTQWVDTIAIAASYGFLVLLFPCYSGFQGGNQGWDTSLQLNSTAQLNAFSTYFAGKFGSLTNLLIVMGGDYSVPTGDQAVYNTIATKLQSLVPSWLFTAHVGDGTNASTIWGSAPWTLHVDSVYTDVTLGHPWIHTNMRASYANTPTRPTFMIESCYEFDNPSGSPPGTEQLIRQQNYESSLNGGLGYVFSSGGSTSPEPLWGFFSGWQTLLGTTGSVDWEVCNGVFDSLPWQKLVPDTGNTFLTNGGSYSGAAFASAARAVDGSWGAIYVPTNESLTVSLSGFRGPVKVSWVDPTTGTQTQVSGSPLAATGSHTFSATPGNNANGDADWVLLFQSLATDIIAYSTNS